MQHENLLSKRLASVKFSPWRDNEADVSSIRPSSPLSDYVTKMTFLALALRRHFPIRLQDDVSSVSSSSSLSD